MTTTAPQARTDDVAPAQTDRPLPLAVQRLRLITVCFGLILLVFCQSAGRTAPDTKLDLVVDPLRFLRRSLTLWDPLGAAGQLQNQAYGYLFPMGPFFVLGKLAGLPAWVVQRGWESALVVVAFLGMVRLARLLGAAGFWPKVAAGLSYALAPRMLSELGSISSELMPMAVLPWVLIPLVTGAERGSTRRAGALAGVALLFAGGVNAAATLAVLPAPALWLLTRQRGRRRRELMLWFGVAVVLASAWWVLPLLLLGRYSPPFLDWIEPSSVTTGITSLIASLRGADHWQAYLGPGIWPGGWILVAVPAVVLATAAVAAAGLTGLGRRAQPHRLFAISCLLLGLALVTMGYVAPVGPPAGGWVRSWLDGPLNAFRNVHKFDPLIRLPLALGLGWLLSRLQTPERWQPRWGGLTLDLRPRLLAPVLAVSIGALAAAPAVVNEVIPQPRSMTEAGWWRQAGSWLGSHSGAGRSLVVPGASRPTYVWGATVDDALQPVARAPWTVRDGIPLTPAGYIRLLDDLSLRMAAGRGDDALAPLLARAGIRYLVVRNDLNTAASAATNLAFVHATLRATPGLSRVTSFGNAPDFPPDRNRLVDVGATAVRPAIEIFEVAGWSGAVGLLPSAGAVHATGSADSLGSLIDAGIAADTPVLFGSDTQGSDAQRSDTQGSDSQGSDSQGSDGQGSDAEGPAATVVTDGIRRKEATFGQSGSTSATLTANQPYRQSRAAQDYLPPSPGPLSTIAYGGGITDIQASSSGAEAGALVNRGAGYGPWSALDGDPATSWRSGALAGVKGQWLSVTLAAPTSEPAVEVAFAATLGGYPNRVRISTDAGVLDSDVSPGPFPQQLALPPGPTRQLRLTVLDASPGASSVGISMFTIAGLTPTRTLVVPTPEAVPDALSFVVEPGGRSNCLTVAGRAACDATFASSGESDGVLDRTFTMPDGQRYDIAATVQARPGAALDALLDDGAGIAATASSVDDPDPRERAGAAVDGDPATSWVSAAGDQAPTLTLDLRSRRLVSTLRLDTDPATALARPQRVAVTAGGRSSTFELPADGVLRLPKPVLTRTVAITVLQAELRSTTSTRFRAPRLLPAGITEVAVNGADNPRLAEQVELGCSSGLAVIVDGIPLPLRAEATREQLLAGQRVAARTCDPAPTTLPAGRHHLRLAASASASPLSLTLRRPGLALAGGSADGTVTPLSWQAAHRTVRVDTPAAAMLVVRENFNPGWQASLNGRRLPAVRLDGWQQAWG
ncbi:MAG TPA: alpha-(1-_3)-arabinofuranosyltransferase family protein, partial [Jatrophihabitans sp.]|uniref:alpha-(1->3)-arabinofuranosyltransferase domain-containing protein n=1 Tax=Jatrophihabitans sp. TaxID=1932789 RepID=UPI002EEB0134